MLRAQYAAFLSPLPLPLPLPLRPPPRASISRPPPLATLSPPLFTASNTPGHALFQTYIHPTPTGTQSLSLLRNLPHATLSTAYGHVLARQIQSEIPHKLPVTPLINALHRSLHGLHAPLHASFSDTLRRLNLAKVDVAPISKRELSQFAATYGALAGRTARLSALQLCPELLVAGVKQRLTQPESSLPMSEAEYEDAFSKLQNVAAEVLGTGHVDAADKFFAQLKSQRDIHHVLSDGYALSIGPHATSKAVEEEDVAILGIRARLFDGRILIDSGEEVDTNGDLNFVRVDLKDVCQAFVNAIVGMSVGTFRTVFYHPYAAREVAPLFAQWELPPQSALVVDLYLHDFQRGSAKHEEER